MAGHSKWSTIKHKKAAADNKRGKLFSKLAKNIMIAARGGSNLADNLKLRYAIERARSEFMPKDSIERAVKKGAGELDGENLDEITYEGIGPGGISIIIEAVTDNRNRTGGEMRNLLEKRGGSLGKTGSVTWKFDRLGALELDRKVLEEEELFEVAIEAGAEDLRTEGDVYQIFTAPENLEAVRQAIEALEEEKNPRQEKAWGEDEDTAPLFSRHEIIWQPQNLIPVDEKTGRSALDLLNLLEDHEDVQNLYCDVDLPDTLEDEEE